MKFIEFSKILEKLEGTSGRTDMTKILAELISRLNLDEIDKAMYLIQGRLVPQYVNLEFNFASKNIIKGLNIFLASNLAKENYLKFGDTGLAVEKSVNYVRENNLNKISLIEEDTVFDASKIDHNLSIIEVYNELCIIAQSSGTGSQEDKINKFIDLISKLDSVGIRYATKIITGELRLGISDKTILDSLSWFVTGDKSIRTKLDYAYGSRSDIGSIAKIILENKNDLSRIDNIKLEPGIPIAAKLVERESDSIAVWERMGTCYVQPKLDGLRGQIHKLDNGTVKIFSRSLEDITEQFPEIVNEVIVLPFSSIILDSEIVGYDFQKNTYLTYQETMKRKRKYDIEKFSNDIPVKAMCFDVIFLNGKDLSQGNLEVRIETLNKIFNEKSKTKTLEMLETIEVTNVEDLEAYYLDKINSGLEGVIIKQLGTNYEPGTRNFKWIKLKANAKSEMVDTIDVVVLGYYVGKGQRSKFGIGALLTGIYSEQTDMYYTLGKVGSGFTDEQLTQIAKDLNSVKIDIKPENYVVNNSLTPDYWVKPEIVAEIDADEITRSPNHTAGIGIKTNVAKDNPEKGLSFRFPRLKVWKRDKKTSNTIEEIIRMYELRKGK